MWKRILLASVLLAICVTTVILCNVFLYRSTDILIKGVDECIQFVDSDEFADCFEKIAQEYTARRTLLSSIMNNRTLDEVDYLVDKLLVLSRQENATDVISENLAALRHQFSRLHDDNRLDIKNIF